MLGSKRLSTEMLCWGYDGCWLEKAFAVKQWESSRCWQFITFLCLQMVSRQRFRKWFLANASADFDFVVELSGRCPDSNIKQHDHHLVLSSDGPPLRSFAYYDSVMNR
jgi:hypothetical protein